MLRNNPIALTAHAGPRNRLGRVTVVHRCLTVMAVLALIQAYTSSTIDQASASVQNDRGPARLRQVYIPHEELEAIFGEGKQGTLLTREQFNELWTKARGELPLIPPADSVPTRARYEARLEEHELRITAHIQVVKLQAAWQTLELPLGGTAIESATIDGRAAQLGRNSDGCLIWVLRDPGRYELVLELSAPIVRTGGDIAVWLQLPPLPSSEFRLHVPQGKQIRVGGVALKPATEPDGTSTVRIPIDKSGQIPLAILSAAGDSKRVPLVFASTDMQVAIEPSGARWQADVTLDVAAQAASQFQFTLPRAVDVASVEALDLAGWSIAEAPDDRWQLTIEFRQPFQGPRRVRVAGLTAIPLGESWTIPNLFVSNAVSHVGEITVQPSATLRVEAAATNAIRRLAAVSATQPPGLAAGARAVPPLRFAYWKPEFTLQLRTTPRERELAVAQASLVDVARSGMTLRTSLTIEPRYAPLFDVALAVPRDWTISSIQIAGTPVAWESSEDERALPADRTGDAEADATQQVIRFDLSQPLPPGNTITVALTAEIHPAKWLEAEGDYSGITLPAVRLLGANEIEGTLIVEAPRDLDLRTRDLSPDLEPIPPPTGAAAGTTLAYRHQDDAVVSGQLEARLKPAQLSVETLAFASLGRESLAVHYQTTLEIVGGDIRSIDFTLPASVGEKIQVAPLNQAIRVTEQQHTAVPAAPGEEEQFLWHIVFDRPVTGQLVLTILLDLSRGGAAAPSAAATDRARGDAVSGSSQTASTRLLLPVVAFRNVARQTGYVAIEAAPDQEVDQQTENLREIDPADLPAPASYQPGRIVAAYQYQRMPFQLRLTGERRDSQEVLAAVCDHASITTVVGREGLLRHRAVYQLRSLGVQYLNVQLPSGANLWAVLLDGAPIEVRRAAGKHVIPLPAGGPNRAAGQHTVEIIYETNISSTAALAAVPGTGDETGSNSSADSKSDAAAERNPPRQSIRNALVPQTIRQSAPLLNMTVLDLQWIVHLPDGMVLVQSDGDFKPAVEPTRPSLIAQLRDTIATNSVQDLTLKVTILAGSLACGVVIWLLVQSRGVLAMAFVAAVLCVIVAVLLPAFRSGRNRAMQTAAKNNLRQIGLGMSNYDRDTAGNTPRESPPAMELAQPHAAEEATLFSRESLSARDRKAAGAESLEKSLGAAKDDRLKGIADFDAEAASEGPAAARHAHSKAAAPLAAPATRALSDRGGMGVDMHDGSVTFGAASGGVNYIAPNPPVVTPANPIAALPAAGLGRLSLAMNFDTRGARAIQFTREGPGDLVLQVQDDTLAQILQWLVTASIGFAAWLFRNRPLSVRYGLAIVCVLVPVGLSGLLPLAWTLVLDGVFVGGLAAIGIWLVVGLVRRLPVRRSGARAAAVPIAARTAVTTGLLILAVAPLASATQSPATGVTPAAAEQVPAQQGELTPVAAKSLDAKPFTVYVPYDPKAGDPRGSRFVYVPFEEFQRLWTLAHPDKPVAPPPGTTAVVAEVGYEGRIDGDVARFDGRIVVYCFQDKWTRVELPLGAVALEKVELDGNPATIEDIPPEEAAKAPPAAPSKPGRLAVFLEKSGMHVIDVQFSVPVSRLGATGRMSIPLRPAAAGRLRFELPEPGLDVHVEGASGGYRVERVHVPEKPDNSQNDAADEHQVTGESSEPVTVVNEPISPREFEVVTLPIGGTGEITIHWQPPRGDLPLSQLISVDQLLLVEVEDSGIHLKGQLHYRIAQGTARKLELRVPKGIAIRAVSGSDVADWSISDHPVAGGERTAPDKRLEIAFKAEVRTGTDVEITAYYVGQEPLGTITIQTLEPIGVARETGRILIGCTSQFHVRIGDTNNVMQIERDGIQLPTGGDAACELLSAYRYTARPWNLQLVVDRLNPRLTMSAQTALALTRERATMHAVLETAVADSPIGSIRFRVPAVMRLNRVTVPPGAEWFMERGENEHYLLVELDQPTTGKIAVDVIGTWALDDNETQLQVPVISLVGAARDSGQIAVLLDPDTDGQQLDAGGARPIAPGELTGALAKVAAAPKLFAYQYNSVPDGLRLRLSAAESKLGADVVSTVSVREGSIAYLCELQFSIRGAARGVLQFTTPDWLGGDLEVNGAGIRQVRSETIPAGRRTWTITLQQPVRGVYPLRLLQSLPVPIDGLIAAAVIEPLGADPVRNYVILDNRSASQLTDVSAQGASPMLPSDVPVSLNDELRRRAISALKVNEGPVAIVWQRQDREQEKAIPASITLADLITVIQRDGTYRTQAAYVVTNRTQQFLDIGLPAGSQLWAAYVAGRPIRPSTTRRGNREVTLVPLQKVSVGDISTQVVLVYSGSLGGKIGRWTELVPPAPDVLGNVPVARTLWAVYTPPEFSSEIVERDSNMSQVAAGDIVVARDLAFLEEMNELVKVCKFSTSRNANLMACGNLKQIGGVLSAFDRPVSLDNTTLTDNRQSWRKAGSADLTQQLEAFLCPSDGALGVVKLGDIKGKDSWGLVQQRARELRGEIGSIAMKQPDWAGFQSDRLDAQFDGYFVMPQSRSAENQSEFAPLALIPEVEQFSDELSRKSELKGHAKLDNQETRRGKLREQNLANVDKLKLEQQQSRAVQSPEPGKRVAPGADYSEQKAPLGNAYSLQGVAGGGRGDLTAVDGDSRWKMVTGLMGSDAALGEGSGTVRAGIQSIDIEIPRVGNPHYFMRLHGDAKLTLTARHHDVTRWSASTAWAIACITLSGLIAAALTRSRATAWLSFYWPWLSIGIGSAWLFLLPLGILGSGFVVVGVSVLAWRTRQARLANAI